ncbi:WD40-repeat-containing domain protein [Suillus lakei]|nr:WD40-repeat-containing domain protein [Suillus lakei]
MNDKELAESMTDQEPVKTFEGHKRDVVSIVTFPEGERFATASNDKTVRIWRLEDGTELKKWVAKKPVATLVIAGNGKHVVSAEGEAPPEDDDNNERYVVDWQLWVRDVESGKRNTGQRLMGLYSNFMGYNHLAEANKLAVATAKNIQIWDWDRRERLAQFDGHRDFNDVANFWLTWTRDSTQLLTAGNIADPVIRSWSTSTWKQAGDPWTASGDRTVRLWQLPTGTEVARFEHSDWLIRAAFSVDGCFLFSGGSDEKVSQWEIPEQVLAAVRSDPLVSKKNKAGPSRGKQRYMKGFFDSEVPGQRHNEPLNYEHIDRSQIQATHSASPRADPSSDKKGKQKARQLKQKAPEVLDVPLGQATYGDVLVQKKKKKPDPPRPIYDDELEDDESEEGIIGVPIPTIQVQSAQHEEIELKLMTSQSQPEAGPSRLAVIEEHPLVQSS